MQTALIIIAIFAAVVLLVRFAAPTAKPKFYVPQRLPQSTVEYRMTLLGKRCAAVERGSGLQFGTVKIDKIISAVRRDINSGKNDLWMQALSDNADYIKKCFSECKKDMAAGAYVGHVGKYPRVFLFCKHLVYGCGLDITTDTVRHYLSIFEHNAKLTAAELNILCGYLTFCLIGGLCAQIELAVKRCASFARGSSDGDSGKLDLDSLTDVEYVYGVISATPHSDIGAVRKILECNDVDIHSAELAVRVFSASTYVVVNAAVRSLKQVEMLKRELASGQSSEKPPPRKYMKFFNIAIPCLIAVYAVFTCIFASPRYVALFSVACILTYAAMRIPVLAYSRGSGINIFSWLDKPIKSLIARIKNRRAVVVIKPVYNTLSEAAYFGSEVEYYSHSLRGQSLILKCDNRGDVVLNGGDVLNLYCCSDNVRIDLCECDGAAERHKITYFLSKGDLGFCAEIFADIDHSACLFKITAVNRSSSEINATIAAALLCRDDRRCTLALFEGGQLLSYGAQCSHIVVVPPFGSISVYGAVAYGSGVRECASVLRTVCSSGYYSCAEDSAYAYCRDNALNIKHDYTFDDYCTNNSAPAYAPPELEESEKIAEQSCVALLRSGEIELCGAAVKNRLVGGDIAVVASQNGITDISFNNERVVALRERVTIMFGEDGVLWSPFDVGTMRTRHGLGYTDYICAYNGIIATVRCCVTESGEAVFTINIENKTVKQRDITAMLSICTGTYGLTTDGDSVLISMPCGGLRLSSSEKNLELSLNKEGYFVRGRIDRACGFRSGGSTPAATISARVHLPKADSKSLCFYLSPEDTFEDDINTNATIEKYSHLGRISLNSSDEVFNLSYRYALYAAYNFGFLSDTEYTGWELFYILSAVKYVDPTTVKKRISALLADNNIDDCEFYIFMLYAAIDFAEYSGDNRLIRHIYADPAVQNAITRAVNVCLDGRVGERRIMLIKAVINVIRYFNIPIQCDLHRKLIAAYSDMVNRLIFSYDCNLPILRALLLYEKNRYDEAYEILVSNNVWYALRDGDDRGISPRLECDEVKAAMYYVAVTECMLGVKIRGKTVKLCPRLQDSIAQLDFDISGAKRTVHVSVDNSGLGNWKMRANNICYSNADIDVSSSDSITLYKDSGY